jgi:ferredoxin-NADP reductase
LADVPHKILLIAGGIGITPIRSMFLEFLKRQADVTLLYSVRSLDDAVFLPELAEVSIGLPIDLGFRNSLCASCRTWMSMYMKKASLTVQSVRQVRSVLKLT